MDLDLSKGVAIGGPEISFVTLEIDGKLVALPRVFPMIPDQMINKIAELVAEKVIKALDLQGE